MIGIYAITNMLNNKRYIGQSTNIATRFSRHRSDLRYSRHHNSHIQNAFNKYGVEIFSFDVLIECQEDELDMYERKFIEQYDSIKKGYNHETGGHDGKHLADETKQKLSKIHKGKKVSSATRQKLSKSLKGRPSPMRGKTAWNRGVPMTKERLDALIESRKGVVPWNKGKSVGKGVPKSAETRRRMSEAMKKLWQTPEYRETHQQPTGGKYVNP